MITIIIFLIALLKKLGALADNEMFGLEPAYILGGKIKIFLYSTN
ncbi:TPA: T6SS immunity protein Tdi1 domain-containing protein [Salmonella enterica subsp. enterica serovar Derby]|nr:T6SS immunity protein Tdi1 domain-containing protein [Salmonella enterica]